jgi:glutamine amidotransferase
MYRSDEVSSAYYFVHSYFVAPNQNYSRVGATIFDSTPYCASIEHETIWGTQFHPELSGPDGLALLQRFLEQP